MFGSGSCPRTLRLTGLELNLQSSDQMNRLSAYLFCKNNHFWFKWPVSEHPSIKQIFGSFMTKSKTCSSFQRVTDMRLEDPGLLDPVIHVLHTEKKKWRQSFWPHFKEKREVMEPSEDMSEPGKIGLWRGLKSFYKSFPAFSYHKSRSGLR